MKNANATVTRRLSDPDFQAGLVNKCLGLMLAMAAALSISLAHDAFVWLNPVSPKYFISDGKGFSRPMTPVDSPIVGDTELLEWSVEALIAPYNVDYYNFASQLNSASHKFTLRGWNTFANSYISQGNFGKLKAASMLCHAQATRAAVINKSGLSEGALGIQVQVPIVQTCENVNQVSTNNLMITALVVRTNDPAHPDGLAIDQLVANAQH